MSLGSTNGLKELQLDRPSKAWLASGRDPGGGPAAGGQKGNTGGVSHPLFLGNGKGFWGRVAPTSGLLMCVCVPWLAPADPEDQRAFPWKLVPTVVWGGLLLQPT